jgi:hypothetical protein
VESRLLWPAELQEGRVIVGVRLATFGITCRFSYSIRKPSIKTHELYQKLAQNNRSWTSEKLNTFFSCKIATAGRQLFTLTRVTSCCNHTQLQIMAQNKPNFSLDEEELIANLARFLT